MNNKADHLAWSDYERLLAWFDDAIFLANSVKEERLRRYQTLIACGGYLGPRAKEFLNLTWHNITQKGKGELYQYKVRRKRPIYFSDKLTRMVESNYLAIDPVNSHHLVLHKQDTPTRPISTRQFNENFKCFLDRADIHIERGSSHTLRKTFGHHIWADLYRKSHEGLVIASEMLDHGDLKETMGYLGITDRKIRETYLKF